MLRPPEHFTGGAAGSNLVTTHSGGREQDPVEHPAERLLSEIREGQRAQAVLCASGSSGQGLSALALLETLAQLCAQDPSAECFLICERRRLHSQEFGELVSRRRRPGVPWTDDLWRRLHIKYVQPPSAGGDGPPPLIEVLVGLQNLPFEPAAIAVLGLADLVRGPGAQGLRGGLWCSTLDLQLVALAVTLLADAAVQLPEATQQARQQGRCAALLWEDAANVDTQLGFLGSVFDAVWSLEESRARDSEPMYSLKRQM